MIRNRFICCEIIAPISANIYISSDGSTGRSAIWILCNCGKVGSTYSASELVGSFNLYSSVVTVCTTYFNVLYCSVSPKVCLLGSCGSQTAVYNVHVMFFLEGKDQLLK
jgi:hypothetical protein